MARTGKSSKRLVFQTEASRADLIAIHFYNETSYGEVHARNFKEFLRSEFEALAENPALGFKVSGLEGYRLYVAKTRRSRNTAGYRVFYREVDEGIEVLRVMHTQRNWPEDLTTDP